MCGLVGIAGDVSYQARDKIFKDMLDLGQVRGRDSTGVIQVKENLDYTWVKRVGPPAFLFDSKEYDRNIVGSTAALIGHNRSKTVGDVSTKTAHPFDFPDKDIVGVHNGTLRNYHKLDGHKTGMVDSEVLYHNVAHNGAEETFKTIEGAWACVWWDGQQKRLNFIRNKERPLWFTWSKDKRMMFWASEIWMFTAASRYIDLWEGEGDKPNKYIELPENTLWSFELNPKAKTGETTMRLINPRVIDPFVQPPAKSSGPHHGGNNNHGAWVRQPDGTWDRADVEASNPYGFHTSGGKVANPFPRLREVLLLDDPLPADFQEDSETTHILLNKSLTNSQPNSGSTKDTSSTKPTPRNMLSLPKMSSPTSQSSNRGEHCAGSGASSRKSGLRLSRGTSLRKVAGMEYITNNTNSQEWSKADFLLNTNGGTCGFCKTKTDDLSKVSIILNPKLFVCNDCVREPKLKVA